jgi:GNAT superfamily N-acetyltransferase
VKCSACIARGWDHDDIVRTTTESLYEFTKYFVSDWVSPNLHKPLFEWYQKERAAGSQCFLIMLPRGSLKTTMWNIGFSIWSLVNNPRTRLLTVMSSARLAKEKVGRMEAILLSPEFKHFYGHLIPEAAGARWNKSEFEVARPVTYEEPSVTGLGSETKMTGGHYDIQIPDDLIDGTAENSEVQMQNAIDFLQMSEGLWVQRDNAHQIVIGTFWPGGFYERLLASSYYSKVVLGCYVDSRYREFMAQLGYEVTADDGTPIYERETERSLARALERFGPQKFANQMLNIPSDSGLVSFRRDDIRYFAWDDDRHKACGIDEVWYPVQTLLRQLTIDPAGSTAKKSDESAIVVSGYARGSSIAFVLDSWSGRVVTKDLIDKAIELAQKWDVNVIKCEFAAMQIVIGGFLRDALSARGLHYPVLAAKTGNKSKGMRICLSLQPWVANGQLYFRRDQPALPDELCSIVTDERGQIRGKYPNLADALAYHAEYWRRTPHVLKTDDEDDIRYEDESDTFVGPVPTRYGLYCPTRAYR